MYMKSLTYLRTINEHQIMDIGASQKVQVLPCLRGPETLFMHAQGQRQPGALLSIIIIFRNTRNAVH